MVIWVCLCVCVCLALSGRRVCEWVYKFMQSVSQVLLLGIFIIPALISPVISFDSSPHAAKQPSKLGSRAAELLRFTSLHNSLVHNFYDAWDASVFVPPKWTAFGAWKHEAREIEHGRQRMIGCTLTDATTLFVEIFARNFLFSCTFHKSSKFSRNFARIFD